MNLLHKHLDKDGFRLRGKETSRVDGFSDAVFGFAVTLLVVSLEVPKSFAQLHDLLRGFFPFAVSFLLLMLVWYSHFKFFRRFGLEDVITLWLNGLLLFFVLFYVYPLKFLFQAAFNSNIITTAPGDMRELTLLYGGGFSAIYLIITALYWNAWRQRDALELDPLERQLTRLYILDEGLLGIIGLLSCLLAILLPSAYAAAATWLFMVIAITKTITGRKIGRANRRFPRLPADSMKTDA